MSLTHRNREAAPDAANRLYFLLRQTHLLTPGHTADGLIRNHPQPHICVLMNINTVSLQFCFREGNIWNYAAAVSTQQPATAKEQESTVQRELLQPHHVYMKGALCLLKHYCAESSAYSFARGSLEVRSQVTGLWGTSAGSGLGWSVSGWCR